MIEIWKDIKGFEGCYQISNLGNVRGLDRIVLNSKNIEIKIKGKVLKQKSDKDGYKLVNLNVTGKGKITFKIHRLVALHFIENDCKEKTQVNHKNLIKNDNRVENLEWVTQTENQRHARRNKKWNRWGVKYEL